MKALRYAKRLVEFDSTSSRSNRLISRYLENKLTKHGFVVERVEYRDHRRVRKVNVMAKKGSGTGGLAYFAHSDTVPANTWFTNRFSPFQPTVAKGRLYGRGSCDMKGSIAAMLDAAQRFAWEELEQPLYVVVTADEETGFDGAKCVVEESKQYREMVRGKAKAIIGEPTMLDVVFAHKGSIELVAVSTGVAAHSSSALGRNANLAMIPFLSEMKAIFDETESQVQWQNDMFQPPTVSWNIIVKDNAPALNVKPSESTCTVFLRTMPDVDVSPLLARAQQSAQALNLQLRIIKLNDPFYVDPQSSFVQEALRIANKPAPITVAYGTDGGIFTELEEKIVFGPGSISQAHTHNEWLSLEQLRLGVQMYEKMIRHWCCQPKSVPPSTPS